MVIDNPCNSGNTFESPEKPRLTYHESPSYFSRTFMLSIPERRGSPGYLTSKDLYMQNLRVYIQEGLAGQRLRDRSVRTAEPRYSAQKHASSFGWSQSSAGSGTLLLRTFGAARTHERSGVDSFCSGHLLWETPGLGCLAPPNARKASPPKYRTLISGHSFLQCCLVLAWHCFSIGRLFAVCH